MQSTAVQEQADQRTAEMSAEVSRLQAELTEAQVLCPAPPRPPKFAIAPHISLGPRAYRVAVSWGPFPSGPLQGSEEIAGNAPRLHHDSYSGNTLCPKSSDANIVLGFYVNNSPAR